jgi:hypothetical protein
VYGVASTGRLLKIIGLFCRVSSLVQGSFAKETYNFKEPTNRSHPICIYEVMFGSNSTCVYTAHIYVFSNGVVALVV